MEQEISSGAHNMLHELGSVWARFWREAPQPEEAGGNSTGRRFSVDGPDSLWYCKSMKVRKQKNPTDKESPAPTNRPATGPSNRLTPIHTNRTGRIVGAVVFGLVGVMLSGCGGIQSNIDAGNQSRIAMTQALTTAIVAVSETPSASDDLAMGFLIGNGAFTVQNADTFVDYSRGAGGFLRELLPFAALIPTGGSNEGEIHAGGDILFSGNKLSDRAALSSLIGTSQTATVDHSAPVIEIIAPEPSQQAADARPND